MNPLNPFPGFNPGCNISLPICRTTNQWLGSGPAPAVVPTYQVMPDSPRGGLSVRVCVRARSRARV